MITKVEGIWFTVTGFHEIELQKLLPFFNVEATNWLHWRGDLSTYKLSGMGCIPAAGVGLENMEEQLDVKSSELFQDPDPYTFIGILREEVGKEERKKPK